MAISADDLPSATLPEETSQFGQATQTERARKAIESQGSGRRTAPQPGGPGAPAQAGPAPSGQGPVQPQPRQPLTPQDLRPGGPVFMQPKLAPTPPWRTELARWASHPNAGPALRALSQRAQAGMRGVPAAGPPPSEP